VGTYFVYHIDKCLGIVSGEMSSHLNLIGVREDGYYQRDAFVRGEGTIDQSLPGRRITLRITIHEDTVKLTGG
jgi:hypothetical protein